MKHRLPVVEPLQRALFLRSLGVFQELHANELALLAQLMHEEWLRRGTVLHQPHQRIDAVRLLVEGSVRLEQPGGLQRRIEAPGGVGMVELLADTEADERAITETNTLALVIDSNTFLDVLEEHFAMVLGIRCALGRRMGELQQRPAAVPSSQPPAATVPCRPSANPLEMAEQLILLQGQSALRPFGVGVLAALIGDRCEVRLSPGDTMWDNGSAPEFFGLIVEGIVLCQDDEPAHVRRAEAGSVVGLDEAFGGMTHAYGVVAETPVVAIRIEVATLLDIAEDHFHVATAILAHCARTLLRLQRREAQSTVTTDATDDQASRASEIGA